VNEKILRAGRELTALNFAQRGWFRQEPALDVPPIPDLAAAVRAFTESPEESHTAGVARTSLVRARNRAIWALHEAARELTYPITTLFPRGKGERASGRSGR
jgi:hypothetical protein